LYIFWDKSSSKPTSSRGKHIIYSHRPEIRISSGHGVRWLADASKFIGFVEPFDPATGKFFERNSPL